MNKEENTGKRGREEQGDVAGDELAPSKTEIMGIWNLVKRPNKNKIPLMGDQGGMRKDRNHGNDKNLMQRITSPIFNVAINKGNEQAASLCGINEDN